MTTLGMGASIGPPDRPRIDCITAGWPNRGVERLTRRLADSGIDLADLGDLFPSDRPMNFGTAKAVLIAIDFTRRPVHKPFLGEPPMPVVVWLSAEEERHYYASFRSQPEFHYAEEIVILDDPKGPLDEIFEALFLLCQPESLAARTPPLSEGLIITFRDHWNEFAELVARNPKILRELDPRAFEEVIAEIASKEGFDVELTQRSRDNGRDILAYKRGFLGDHLHFIECKRYKESRKIDVGVVRSLYGVMQRDRANSAALVTTSYFSKPAQDYAFPISHHLTLQDFDGLKDWFEKFKA